MARILFTQLQPYAYPGLYYICGALKAAGHKYEVIAGNNFEYMADRVRVFEPDLIGFPCFTGIHRDVLAVAARLKNEFPRCKILLGGIHPTLFPQIIKDKSVDFVCRGEGEQPICELLDALAAGAKTYDIPNISWKENGKIHENEMRPLVDPLDSLPFPDYSIYSAIPSIAGDTYPAVFMIRGCPFSCTYCHNSNQRKIFSGKGKYVRAFSVERILAEAESVLRFYPKARAIFLGADTLGNDMAWLTELLTKYRARFKLPYTCLIRPEFINENLVKLLKETNCHMLAFGVESGSGRVRRELLGRNYSNQQLLDAAALLKKYGIKFRTYNMIGLPTETREEMIETLKLNIKIRPEYPWCSIFTPYPETKLSELCIENGFLDDDFTYDDVPTSFFNGSVLKKVDNNFILNLHSFFQLSVMFPSLYPVVSRFLVLPHNRFFRYVFKAVYSYVCIRSENRSVYSFLRLALANRKLFK
jgi:radical SAM superfamily enzyme YgiQ (UPF0313 family)